MHRLTTILLAALLASGCLGSAEAPPRATTATLTLAGLTQDAWCPALWVLDPPTADGRVLVANNETAQALQQHVGHTLHVASERVTICEGHTAHQVVEWATA